MIALMAAATAVPLDGHAFNIATDVSGLSIRWDNKVSYTAAFRRDRPSEALINVPPTTVNQDDGDRNFGEGLISNRVDLFSEFDLAYGNFGDRPAGALFTDLPSGLPRRRHKRSGRYRLFAERPIAGDLQRLRNQRRR
jgi:hypothetical protein